MGVMAFKAHGKYSRVLYVILPLPVKLSPALKVRQTSVCGQVTPS